MNTRFTIEEENIVAIYAEDSRETTLSVMACSLFTAAAASWRISSSM